MRVEDTGPGFRSHRDASSNGIGLSNTRARLRQLYGESQSFEVFDRAAGGVEASLSLPFRRGAAPTSEDASKASGDAREEDAE